ncbi:hypothetical protein [Arsenophonus endosymbiont of Aphis craccivora]|uniref:hypothetical protein n=1 Tax=Arsenophonus endosymbiont of Aphis craccivora TaxID=1231049 RepID=UPI0015DF7D9A|nr:hypothetical protein [Arsenophonus endosymbiont of Aphis craccivora]
MLRLEIWLSYFTACIFSADYDVAILTSAASAKAAVEPTINSDDVKVIIAQ